ncbi:MAG: CDP-alcohol phosphatidyltransferase family protein [Bacteroidetes bacterium]|nr:CDP-alcohol phosphatidyltransferase family protein [Bacteroidota bacterium]MCZ6757150.1 CDP-alcohol phosphatidyltransferase family protein [Bacteroidota bacterium]
MDPKPAIKGWSELGKFWTIPNVLSLARIIILVPVAYLILVDGSLLWILSLVALAIASDYFDGRLARWSHSVSEWGKVLDPFSDKIGGGLVVAALMIKGSLPVWYLIVILTRDLLIMLGGELIIRRSGIVVMSLFSGKIAVASISITVLAALLLADPPVMQFCLVASTVILAYSFLRYFARFVTLMKVPNKFELQNEGDG